MTTATAAPVREEIAARFSPDLLSHSSRTAFRTQYAASQPYKHAVVDGLISDELLRQAREEIVEELRFTEKETDIYKVNQTGDLANLDGLPEAEADRLKYLLKVRDAIYSPEFRQWLQDVTGCGPLSAKKKDMSINDYRQGCHLLNHDDVIATRRVSYILYLPDPAQPWQPEWGGALELYPVKGTGEEGHAREPENVPSVVIPPKWNQYTFFAVQPGHSFHSVEEVAHPTASRLSISGWFHRPQPGEDGFDPADEAREEQERKGHASAEAISSKRFAATFHSYPEDAQPPLPGDQMSQADVDFLRPFLNPAYLAPKTQSQLFEKFGDDSHILLADVFNSKVATALEKALKAMDDKDGFRWWTRGKGEEGVVIPSQQAGVSSPDWEIVGPPHRQRYLSLRPTSADASAALGTNPSLPSPLPLDNPAELLDTIRTRLLPSPAFRHFLANITQLLPLSHRPFEVRRFRPGLDYSLARADDEAVLDVVFGLTPDMARVALDAAGGGAAGAGPRGLAGRGKAVKKPKTSAPQLSKKQAKDVAARWESGEVGGWACYMAPDEEDQGATGEVYRQAGGSRRDADDEGEGEGEGEDADEKSAQNGTPSQPRQQRKNLKDFDMQYLVLSLRASGKLTLDEAQLHAAITQACVSLHGDVGGAFHVDVIAIKPSDAEGESGDGAASALVRVASQHLDALASALSTALVLPGGARASVRSTGSAFSLAQGPDGSAWLSELAPPSGRGGGGGGGGGGDAGGGGGGDAPVGEGGSSAGAADEENDDEDGDAEMASGDEEEHDDDDADSDFDGVLLNLTPSFNTLSVALRDEGVLHFVKYLSATAGGSRWDLVGEWGVGAVEEEEEGEGEE